MLKLIRKRTMSFTLRQASHESQRLNPNKVPELRGTQCERALLEIRGICYAAAIRTDQDSQLERSWAKLKVDHFGCNKRRRTWM